MKAILVIDMPDNCRDCPCFYDWLYCQAKDGLCVIGENKPDGCPLKPAPKKSDETSDKISDYDYETAFNDGWNMCISEILGANNESNISN